MTTHIKTSSSARVESGVSAENEKIIIAFFVLQTIGFVGLLLMLFTTILAKGVNRHSAWTSFTFSWLFSTLGYCLLPFTGHLHIKPPPFGLCITQSALVYSTPPLAACATLGLAIQVWLDVRASIYQGATQPRKIWLGLLLAVPYITFLAIFFGCIGAGLRNPRIVQLAESGLYCNFTITVMTRISSALVAVLLLPTLAFEISLVIMLQSHWSASLVCSLASVIRLVFFTAFGFVAVVMGFVFFIGLHRGSSGEFDLILAVIPVAAVVIFGSQADMVRTWLCLGRERVYVTECKTAMPV